MKYWPIVSCLLLLWACESGVEETVVTKSQSDSESSVVAGRTDTSVIFEKDTSSHASFTIAPIKKPSGIYQFLMKDGGTQILHTIAFYPNSFHLEEEFGGRQDSVVVTEGTWAPSQGFIWLYKEQLVRGRYVWKGDSLQYFSPKTNKKFSMTKLTPAGTNPALQALKKEGVSLYGVGTEPFWSVQVKKQDSVIVSMPDWSEPLRVKLTGTQIQNKVTIYTAKADSVKVSFQPGFCSDGMSDFIYSHKVVLTYKGQTFHGCGIAL